MSKYETWRTRKYWEQTGGLLIEEFLAVSSGKNHNNRRIDGLIVLGEKTGIHDSNIYDIKDKDVIVIQTKSGRMGMYLLGQAYFSKFLVENHQPRSIKSVAICGKSDTIMEELASKHDLEIVVI